MDLGIAGRVALVTAASKGLGRAAAEALAAEGVKVALASRTQPDIERVAAEIEGKTGVQTLGLACDVSNAADLNRVVHGAESTLGPIDIAVINTGGPPPGDFSAADESMWDAGIDNTLKPVVRLTKLVAPGMRQRKWGRLVNITSITSRQPMHGLVISNALRPAIHGLVKDISDELAADGVTINSVAPGLHATERLMHVAEARNPDDPKKALAELAKDVPAGRLGDPADLGAAIAFLCSQQAGYITGESLVIDGGYVRGIC